MRGFRSRKALGLCGTAATALAAFAQPVPAFAQQRNYSLNIPAQELGAALRAFGRATRLQVTFDQRAVRGHRAPALGGSFTAETALAQLLAGSGLTADRGRSGIYIVRPATAAGEGEAGGAAADNGSAEDGSSNEEESIVVTGSRIARANYDTAQPAIVIDSAQIENRGFETLGQALNEQPAFGAPGASPIGFQAGPNGGSYGGAYGAGQSFVNFLGIGAQRTLVLINGRRVVSSNTSTVLGPASPGQQVDLNTINTRLVERVETIAIGGAPVYGSDAIAGTVNVILRRDFQGFEVDGQFGVSDHGDAENYRMRAIWGRNFADGRVNLTASGEYNRGDGLQVSDRAVTAQSLFYDNCPAGSQFVTCLYQDRRLPFLSEGGSLLVRDSVPRSSGFSTVNDAQGRPLQFDTAGNLIPIDFGTPPPFSLFTVGGTGYDTNRNQSLLTDSERYNFNLLGSFQISPAVRFFVEGWYAHSRAVQLGTEPFYNTAFFGGGGQPQGNLIISVDNPFLTAAQRQTILASIAANPNSDQNFRRANGQPNFVQDYFYMARANVDLDPRETISTTDLYRFVGGFDGTFDLGGRDFRWEVVGNFGRAEVKGRLPVIIQQNFLNALNPTSATQCAPGAVNSPLPVRNPTCTPLNLFGSGRSSQAAIDYITTVATPRVANEQVVLTASVSGPLARLPGGDLSIAAGVEHRRESTDFKPGAFLLGAADPNPAVDANGDGDPANDRVPYGRGPNVLPVAGQFSTNELFGELTAEIFGPANDIAGFHRLELHGAARYVDNSVAGGDLTWTVEGRWAPVEDITFRGNFTRAIRAPAITEFFNPFSPTRSFAVDPCDSRNRASGPDPATRQANCAAAGLPANFISTTDSASFASQTRGNPDLENERSDAWSAGVVITPRWIPNLRLSADYLDIKLTDAISRFDATQVANACYDAADYPNNAFCQGLRRDPVSGDLVFADLTFYNAAQTRYKGILGALDYRVGTPFLGAGSTVDVNVSYQYLDTLETRSTPSAAPAAFQGTLGYPRHSGVLNLTYTNGPFLLSTSFNYTGPVGYAGEPENFREFPRLDAVVYVNGSIAYRLTEDIRLRLSVDNIFDEGAPFPVPANGGLVSYFSGFMGRYFRFGASVRF